MKLTDTVIFCGKCMKRFRKIPLENKNRNRFKIGRIVNGRCDRCEQDETANKGKMQ